MSTTTKILWMVFISILLVLLPHTAWLFRQFEPADSVRLLGEFDAADLLSYIAAFAFESAIAVLIHKLAKHIESMKKGKTAWAKFSYSYLNPFAVGLYIATAISMLANLAHAVEFGVSIKIFTEWGVPAWVYSVAFGGILPLVSLTFARVLSNVTDDEDGPNPELTEANTRLREANRRAAESEQRAKAAEAKANTIQAEAEQRVKESEQRYSVKLREAERLLEDSEQRYRAFGDVIRYLFGTDLALRDRIRGIRTQFPNLSQNGIAQLLGCSVSTVNGALDGYIVEMPIDVTSELAVK
jgi:hypothetical protein